MTTELTTLLTSPTALRIGWTLLHFLWQATLVAALLATLLQLMHRTTAQARYLAACAALALLAILPLITAALIEIPTPPQALSRSPLLLAPLPAPSASPQLAARPPTNPPPTVAPPTAPITNYQLPITRSLTPLLPYAVLLYILGLAGMSLYQLTGYLLLLRIRQLATPLTQAPTLQLFHSLRTRLHIKSPVKLLQFAPGAALKTPIALGILRPAILLPVSLLTTLSPDQLEAILAHELAHIRRHDCLIKILQATLETLLFFHPAVWWISSRITQESEICCDETALQISPNRDHYAQTLALIAGAYTPTLTPAATSGKLLPRLRRILAIPETRSTPRTLVSAILALTLLAAVIAIPLACSPRTSTNPADTTSTDTGRASDNKPGPRGIILAPKVDIGEIYVKGNVKHPGVYAVHGGSPTLLQAVIAAGIDNQREPQLVVKLTRREGENKETVIEANLGAIQRGEEDDWMLQSDDLLEVSPAGTLQNPATRPASTTQHQAIAEIRKMGAQVDTDVEGQAVGISFRASNKTLTDEGLKYLKVLNQLKLLDLTGTAIGDTGMEHLRELKTIQVLFLGQTKITDAGLKNLASMSNLEYLVLEDTRVTDKGLESIKNLKHIRTLNLNSTKLTDAGMKVLEGFGDLQNLSCDGTRITDSGLAHLKALNALEKLSLRVTNVTDIGLQQLKGLIHLQALDLTGTKVTAGGLAMLRKALPNCTIDP